MSQPEIEEDALAALLHETLQAHFLRSLTMPEALAVLRERHDIARRLLSHLAGEPEPYIAASLLMLDHYRALLEAEVAWLERSIALLRVHESSLLN